MNSCELIRCESPDALAASAADDWLESVRSRSGSIGLAVSGGRIAGRFFEACVRWCANHPMALDNAHFFWADERCVPPESDESNYQLAWDRFLDPLRIRTTNIHRIRGEIDPVEAALQAELDLRTWFFSDCPDQACPVLDFIFLGMGEDGHVASLFPDGPNPDEATGLFIPVTASKPPPRRISMSYQVISAAKEVFVLASGKGKETALEASIAPQGDTPLARVLKTREYTRIYTDILH